MSTKSRPAGSGRVYNLRSNIPVKKKTGTTTKTDATKPRPSTKARAIPDFKKLHENWNDKFNKGKAVKKKTCTQIQAFDLTRPVTRSQKSFKRDEVAVDEREEYLDDEALQSVLDKTSVDKQQASTECLFETTNSVSSRILRSHQNPPKPVKSSKDKLAAKQIGHGNIKDTSKTELVTKSRKIPINALQVRQHHKETRQQKAHTIKDEVKMDKKENEYDGKPEKISMKDMQKEFDIEFKTDVGALNSILNNTGISHARPIARQTTAGIANSKYGGNRPNKAYLRTSIYDRPVRNSIYDRRWTKANFRTQMTSKWNNKTPSPVKQMLTTPARVLQPRNQNQLVIKTPGVKTPGKGIYGLTTTMPKTPVTASRVANLKFSAMVPTAPSPCQSPAVRKTVNIPTPQRVTRPQSSTKKKVRWAEVLKSPEDHTAIKQSEIDEIVTILKFTDVDDNETKENEMKPEQNTTEEYLQKVIELEKQLLQEIHKLQEERKPIQNESCDSAHPINEQAIQKASSIAHTDLKFVKIQEDLLNADNDSESSCEPLDLTVKAPSRTVNEAQSVFKLPLPMDRVHPVRPQTSTTSVNSSRMLQNVTAKAAVTSRLCSATDGVKASPLMVNNRLDNPSMPTSNTPKSMRTPLSSDSNTNLHSLNSELHSLNSDLQSGFDGLIAMHQISQERTPSRKFSALENNTSGQMQYISEHFKTASSLYNHGLHKHTDGTITDQSAHTTLSLSSPNSDDTECHAKKSEHMEAEVLISGVVSVPTPLKRVTKTVQYESPYGEIEKRRHVAHSAPSVHEDRKISSSITQPSEGFTNIQPLSPCEVPDKEYYRMTSIYPSEYSNLTSVALHRDRLLALSNIVISPVPRYANKPKCMTVNGTALNSQLPLHNDGHMDKGQRSDSSSKSVQLTHVQKLQHAIALGNNGGKYEEVFLNEEVALFACRLRSKFSPKPKVPHNFTNPLATTLLHGDERVHFIPIDDATELKALPIPGSAFMALKH
ncbi:uncharacterized protein [Antedon mediterranea]|uniref:uncharacterized protein n=1 Tax=Antedon mediterranea TaxID=105859 RepID=UPI003AF9DCEF